MHVESPLAKQLAKEAQERDLREANERLQAMEADVAAGKVPAGAGGGSAKFHSGSPSGAVSEAAASANTSSGSLSFYDDKSSRRSSPVHTANRNENSPPTMTPAP